MLSGEVALHATHAALSILTSKSRSNLKVKVTLSLRLTNREGV
jgi:hypothetical protein